MPPPQLIGAGVLQIDTDQRCVFETAGVPLGLEMVVEQRVLHLFVAQITEAAHGALVVIQAVLVNRALLLIGAAVTGVLAECPDIVEVMLKLITQRPLFYIVLVEVGSPTKRSVAIRP